MFFTRYDVIPWQLFNRSHVFTPDDHRNCAPLSGALLQDITVTLMHRNCTPLSGALLQDFTVTLKHRNCAPLSGALLQDITVTLRHRNCAPLSGALLQDITGALRQVLAFLKWVPHALVVKEDIDKIVKATPPAMIPLKVLKHVTKSNHLSWHVNAKPFNEPNSYTAQRI